MSFQFIQLDREGSMAILRLAFGKLNAISPELLEECHGALDELERDRGLSGLVITGGTSRFFSYGLDVARLLTVNRSALGPFMKSFNRLLARIYGFPLPVGAAVNGHATAGGLLLVLAADCRVAAEGNFSAGLSEVKLGLAPPAAALRMMARRLGSPATALLSLRGMMLTPEAARDLGIYETIVPADRLLGETMKRVQAIAGPPGATALNKRFLCAGVFDLPDAVQDREIEEWLDRWYSPEAQAELHKLAERK
jgi:enoyl-CoA hydratase/carnithine racemase